MSPGFDSSGGEQAPMPTHPLGSSSSPLIVLAFAVCNRLGRFNVGGGFGLPDRRNPDRCDVGRD
jgi:hypothetical protein